MNTYSSNGFNEVIYRVMRAVVLMLVLVLVLVAVVDAENLAVVVVWW